MTQEATESGAGTGSAAQTKLDPKARKIALGAIETGIYLVGAAHDGTKNLMIASWVCQCSFEPPTIMFGLKRGTLTHQLVKDSGGFTVNILAKDQRELAKKFFKHEEPMEDKIHGERFRRSPRYGAPILEVAPAWLEAKAVARVDAGDHEVIVAEVVAVGAPGGERFEPLLESNSGWRYGG